jgi:microcystin-dependent protein
MPAVAQISVDFSSRSEITNPRTNTLPINVKSINPLTLTQYLLYSRELTRIGENFGLQNPTHLKYDGGFITAGDKINVKHNDLQLRKNLEVSEFVQTEFIVSRTKNKTDTDYQTIRQNNTRAVTISPRSEDLSSNYFNISTDPTTRRITLYTFRTGVNKESSIIVSNVDSNVSISSKTDTFNVNAQSININNGGAPSGLTTHTGPVVITGVTTVNNIVNIENNLNIGGTSFNRFNVTASNGNVAFIGNLTINTDKFTVTSASGNTVIAGTLALAGNLSIGTNRFTVNSSSGNTVIAGTLNTTGAVVFSSTLEVTQDTNLKSNLDVDGNTNIDGTLNVVSSMTIGNNLTLNNGNFIINTGSPLSEKFKVLHASGNTSIAGTLSVGSSTSIVGITTTSNRINMTGGANNNAPERRITGVRTLASITEFNSSTYDNDAITVGDVKKYGFKEGMIMMWSVPSGQNYSTFFNSNGVGIGIMTGWQICNGLNGSPDLRDRFVVGAGSSYSLNDRAGVNAVALNVNQIPAHNHNSSNSTTNEDISISISGNTQGGGAHGHGLQAGAVITQDVEVGGRLWRTGEQKQLASAGTWAAAGDHTHGFSGNASFTLYTRGGGQTHENRPPYHALFYIIKT